MARNALDILQLSCFCESFFVCNGYQRSFEKKKTTPYGPSCQEVAVVLGFELPLSITIDQADCGRAL